MHTSSIVAMSVIAGAAAPTAIAAPLPPDASYRPLPTVPLDVVRRNDEAAKPAKLVLVRVPAGRDRRHQ